MQPDFKVLRFFECRAYDLEAKSKTQIRAYPKDGFKVIAVRQGEVWLWSKQDTIRLINENGDVIIKTQGKKFLAELPLPRLPFIEKLLNLNGQYATLGEIAVIKTSK